MMINANYQLLYDVANGLMALEQLDRMELVSVALCVSRSLNPLESDVVDVARLMCVDRLKAHLEDEYNAKLDAMPQWWKDDMNALGYDTVEDDGRDRGD